MSFRAKGLNKMTYPNFPIHIQKVMASKKTSSRQFEIMLNFFEKNMRVLRGKCDLEFTREEMKSKWEELAQLLNNVGEGPKKSEEKWKKTLKDWKGYVKGKARRIALHNRTTGGDPPCKDTLTRSDQKLLSLLAKIDGKDGTEDLIKEELNGGNDSLAEKIGNYLSVEMTDIDHESDSMADENIFAPINRSLKSSQDPQKKKETILTDIAFRIMEMQKEILNSQKKILSVEERKADAAIRKASALERIAAAKEREACAVEGMYLLKRQKLEREDHCSPKRNKTITDNINLIEL